jgi:hypothetical protein
VDWIQIRASGGRISKRRREMWKWMRSLLTEARGKKKRKLERRLAELLAKHGRGIAEMKKIQAKIFLIEKVEKIFPQQ